MKEPVHLLLFVLAIVLFFLGILPWPPFEAWRVRIVSAGLFCWALSTLITV
jgi:hypothetical protein